MVVKSRPSFEQRGKRIRLPIRVSLVLLASLLGTSAMATDVTATGLIDKIYQYANGTVVVTGLSWQGGANCPGFYIDGTNPNAGKLLAMLLAAKASSMSITVVATQCNGWHALVDHASPSNYITLN